MHYQILIVIFLAYLLGSIPFGLLLTKAVGLGDIRAIGSGNIGATNVLRTGRKDIAIATLLLDAFKAMLALLIGRHFGGQDLGMLAGVMAFLGHCFPIWLKFKGGKGVATFVGLSLVAHWPLGIAVILIWLSVAYFSRYSSLAALSAAAFSVVISFLMGLSPVTSTGFAVMAIILFVRHGENIARLRAGTESKISFGKKSASDAGA